MPNRLLNSSSPYLRQHAENPVDWFSWSEEALQKAKRENRPIFLSIGYSSCHWCHVMEQESFSRPEVAEVLNRLYVPIKVDREERPDLDHVYMQAVQMMTGQGGWPLNVFLTPDLKPYFGGTYFPLEPKYGRPGFLKVLTTLREVFDQRKSEVDQNTQQVSGMLIQTSQFFHPEEKLDFDGLMAGIEQNVDRNFEPQHGGLGQAPKFFHTDGLRVLLRSSVLRGSTLTQQDQQVRLEKVLFSLRRMAEGGVYDQVGGGFHRYSTDLAWQIPHFEKMLYDNALLASLYLEAFELTRDSFFARIAREIFEWARRELYSSEFGFYSALDADTNHREGAFYAWTFSELKERLAEEEVQFLIRTFGVSLEGNFEGMNILCVKEPLEEAFWKPLRAKLLALRDERPRPLTDTKVLASWNGLMISALVLGARVLQDESLLTWAEEAGRNLWRSHFKEGRLRHSGVDGAVGNEGFLEDSAYVAAAYLDLFQQSGEEIWADRAGALVRILREELYDAEKGGFWSTFEDQKDLIVRYKEIFDGALPAPQSVAFESCLRVISISADLSFKTLVESSIQSYAGTIRQSPGGFHRLWFVMDALKRGVQPMMGCGPEGCSTLESRAAPYDEKATGL